MTNQQQRRLSSYQSILDHFDGQPQVWSGKPPAVKAIGAWRALLQEVRAQAQIQARNTTGQTLSHDEHEAFVIRLAMTLVQRLRAYARLENDPELLAIVDVSESDLLNTSEADRVRTLKTITNAARERDPAALVEYEVTEALLDELDAEAARLLPQTSARDGAEDAKTVATTQLAALFPQFPPLRDTLDDVVDGLLGDADFRDGYYQARKVDG